MNQFIMFTGDASTKAEQTSIVHWIQIREVVNAMHNASCRKQHPSYPSTYPSIVDPSQVGHQPSQDDDLWSSGLPSAWAYKGLRAAGFGRRLCPFTASTSWASCRSRWRHQHCCILCCYPESLSLLSGRWFNSNTSKEISLPRAKYNK